MRSYGGMGKGSWDRCPLPPPPTRNCAPSAASMHFPSCAPSPCAPALQEGHDRGPGEEPASLGPIRSRQGGPPQGGFASGQVYLEGRRERGQRGSPSWGERGDPHGEREWWDGPVGPPPPPRTPPHVQPPAPTAARDGAKAQSYDATVPG